MSLHKYCKCGVPEIFHGDSCGWLKAKKPIACPQTDEEREWHIKWDEARRNNVQILPTAQMHIHTNEKERMKFETSLVKCDLCSYHWVAVRPFGLTKLECPNCNNMVYFENISND